MTDVRTAVPIAPPLPGAAPLSASSRGRPVLVTFAIATAVGLALAIQTVLAMASFGRTIPWFAAILNLVRESWLWALLVPLVFALSRRFPLHVEAWWKSLTAHLFGAAACALIFSVLNTAIIEWLTPEHLHPSNVFGPRRTQSTPSPTAPGTAPATAPTTSSSTSPPLSRRFWFGFASRIQPNLFTYALIVAIWHWLDHQRRLRERDRQSQELSRQLAEVRLQALRMQLNPHFLFNTLNAIATLVHRDPHAADEMIACLSDFLRLTLSSQNSPQTPLRTELEFARRYLDIEKVRFGDRLEVHEDISPECLGEPIPTLVLQPLLENSIRHGIERSEDNGRIDLSARQEGGQIVLRIGNTGPEFDPRADGSRGTGVGLANTRARLRELHGDAASLLLAHRPGGGLDVEIRLPRSESPTPLLPA